MTAARKVALRVNGFRMTKARVRCAPTGLELIITDPLLGDFAIDDRFTGTIGALETGLCMCPVEKSRDRDPLLSRAVRSLQSGLSRKNREIRACFAYFGGTGGEISLQLRLHGGEGGTRTPDTVSPR